MSSSTKFKGATLTPDDDMVDGMFEYMETPATKPPPSVRRAMIKHNDYYRDPAESMAKRPAKRRDAKEAEYAGTYLDPVQVNGGGMASRPPAGRVPTMRDGAPPLPTARPPSQYLEPVPVDESTKRAQKRDSQAELIPKSTNNRQGGGSAVYSRKADNIALQYSPSETRGLTNQSHDQYFLNGKDGNLHESFALRHLNAILAVCLVLGLLGLVALVLSGLIVAGTISVSCQCSTSTATGILQASNGAQTAGLRGQTSNNSALRGEPGSPGRPGGKGDKGDIGRTEKGEPGAKGEQGNVGPQGPKGQVGLRGLNGTAGPQGLKGQVGLRGLNGTAGSRGPKGDAGPPGAKGDSGISSNGIKGEPGSPGPKGDEGPQGPAGAKGLPGSSGGQGPKGDKGNTGSDGSKGLLGSKGEPGTNGIQGIQGLQGPTGSVGAKGEQGTKGDPGDTGATGGTGAKGQGGSKGDKGDRGKKGPSGDD